MLKSAAGCWLLAAGLAACGTREVAAQLPRTYRVRADNDAFDFWRAPYNRPDEEYTSGVHITVDGGDAPWWARRWLNTVPCTSKTSDCRTSSAEIGQDIYSPATSVDDPRPAAGSRPNAGWLYVSQAARLLRERSADALTFTVGVTGPPSLARQTQDFFHSLAPAFNRPTDWDRQIPFHAGVIARYERQERVVLSDASMGLEVIPRVAASLGNVATNLEAGAEVRTGWNLRHPWLPSNGPTEIALTFGASARAVASDLFLDAHAPYDGIRISHRPLVGRADIGLEFSHKWLTLGYRVTSDTRSYALAPQWHPWSSLVGSITVDR